MGTQPVDVARSLLIGAFIGVFASAANVYTGLKVAFVDPGAMAAAILAFAFMRRNAERNEGVADLVNIAQTTSASAAVMVVVTGLAGPVPALDMIGDLPPSWVWAAWGCGLGGLGIWIAVALRGALIDHSDLAFPTGVATAEVIEVMTRDQAVGRRSATALVGFAIGAALLTGLRNSSGVLPESWMLPIAIAGVPAAALTLGFSLSPLVAATGALVGLRVTSSMVLGSLVAWVILVPRLLACHAIERLEYGSAMTWLMWPGVTLMMSSVLAAFVMDFSRAGGLLDLGRLGRELRDRSSLRWTGVLAVIAVLAVGVLALDLSLRLVVAALAITLVLATISARAVGETDVAPVGQIGTITQGLMGSGSLPSSLLAGSLSAGVTASVAQSLWSFKTTAKLGTPRGPIVLAQVLGMVVGALVAVPTYALVVRTHGLGTADMPAWGAVAWRVTAEAVQGSGGMSLPPWATLAVALACVAGVGLTTLERGFGWRWLPSPVALAMGLMSPVSFSATMAFGALIALGVARRRPAAHIAEAASGAIAGESLCAVAVALVAAAR